VTQSLAGRRILVTRSAHQAGKLSEGLRARGAEPIEVPVIEIQPPASLDPLDQALQHIYGYDWLIVTSANTVRVLGERAAALTIDLLSQPLHVAAIGQATADAARQLNLKVTLTPETYVAEGLVSALADRIRGKHVLLARASIARDVIPDALRAAGATLNVVDAYQNVIPAAAPEQLRCVLAAGVDAATFTSSSSATHLAEVAQKAKQPFPFRGVPAVSIGPVTSQTLRELGWPPAAEAQVHDIPGLISAVVSFFSRPSVSL
jgi:uroporphyrinogen-III synthase